MQTLDRRRMLAATLALAAVPATTARGQSFPSRPITLVSTFGPGSPQDLVLRAMADLVAADLRQPVIVESKPGAGGALSASFIATQKPDGYSVGANVSAAFAVLPALQKVSYDPVTDFSFLMGIGSFPLGIAVKAESPFKSWADVVVFAKANPGKITYGTPGLGSIVNLGMNRLQALAGLQLTHVPFKGVPEIIPAVLGDHVHLMATGTEWKPQVEAGKMRLLMTLSERRLPAFLSVPTARESGYPFDLDVDFGLIAPKGLDPAAAAVFHAAFKKAHEAPAIRSLFAKYDIVPAYTNGPDFAARIRKVAAELKPIIDQLGLTRKE